MLTHPPIEEGLMPERDKRRINAALGALGLTQGRFAEQEDIDQYRVSKMLHQNQKVTASYARAFNSLLKRAQKDLQRISEAA